MDFNALGLAYLNAGRGQEAYRALLLVRRLYPENWAATLGLAALHTGTGELDTAKELFDEALKQGGDTARTAAADFPVLKDLTAE